MAAGSRGRTRCDTGMAMPAHARELLAELDESIDTRLLVTDGVFSMDGDLAPLARAGARVRASTARG